MEWQSLSSLTRELVFGIYIYPLGSNEGNKYINNTRVCTETVHRASTPCLTRSVYVLLMAPQLITERFTIFTGGNRTKLPSSRWRRRGRSLREVFACSRLFATTDLSQIYNRDARRHGTPCTKTTDSYLFSFLYNNPRKIRRETTVGKFVPNNGRR